ncbi:hypothetical protein ACLI1A_10305 [Flavobacterium sp. RHBU_3]|uniref:hypothetical protein n=1 Tax=Flavobacterium sp. RHBU_3 TaxID=3391184 RepID=UPI0039850D32
MTLPPVKFKKVKRDQAVELQALLTEYLQLQAQDLTHQQSVRFHSAVQDVALIIELYLVLRTKLESRKPQFSLSLKVQHAVILLFACNKCFLQDGSYKSLTALVFINEIDQQLKSLNVNLQF